MATPAVVPKVDAMPRRQIVAHFLSDALRPLSHPGCSASHGKGDKSLATEALNRMAGWRLL
jgi:hypothetical protein